MIKSSYGFDVGDGLQLGEDVVDVGGGGRIEFGAEGSGDTGAGDHARRAHGEFVLEGAQGDVAVSRLPDGTPRIGDIQSRHQKVDEIVRSDGAHVPLEPTQHQQLPLLNHPKKYRKDF